MGTFAQITETPPIVDDMLRKLNDQATSTVSQTTEKDTPEYEYDVFISYSHKDKGWVCDQLLRPLEQVALKVLIDYRNFKIGLPALTNMEEAVEKSRHIVLVLTPDWVASEWAGFESLLAATNDPAGRRRRVLPLMLKQCEPPKHIRFLTYADFTDSERHSEEMARLTKAMSKHAAVQELFPARNEKAAASARDGFTVLGELAKQPAVLSHIVAYKVIFGQTREQIRRVGRYKDLHDCLHELQIHCYNQIVQELKRFPQDDVARGNLIEHEQTLHSNIERIKEFAHGVNFLTNEQGWIEDLVAVEQALIEALDKSDAEHLKTAAYGLRRVLSVQPSRFNTRLNEAARNLPLQRLAEAMRELVEKISELNQEETKLKQLEEGVAALDRLNFALELLIKDHDDWQVVNTEMGRIEREQEIDPDQFEGSWEYLKKQTEPLCARSIERWVDSFKQEGERVQRAIQEQNPVRMRESFRRYCRQADDRFYRVDVSLKNLCDDLREVGGPLAAVLRIISR